MTQERLVTLESAKKLKLLGFNELCDNCNKSLNESVITFDLKGFHNSMNGVITRPTQCHVQRWLFKKGYFVSTSFAFKEFDKEAEDCDNAKMLFIIRPEIYKIEEVKPLLFSRTFMNELVDIITANTYTNEDVLEFAINYVLDEMIKNKNVSKSNI